MTPPPVRQRRWLMGAVAAGALGAGVWWRGAGRSSPAGGDSAALSAQAQAQLWSAVLARPEGGDLALASLRGRPLLLNFWATWCPPCVRELPLLDRAWRQRGQADWQLLGVAIDGPTPVREFLARQPLGFAVALGGLDGAELMRALGNAPGGLPFSLLLDGAGVPVQRQLGELSEAQLQRWLAGLQPR